jgi:hypothetical protein
MARTGRCLCGFVRYELEGSLGPLVNCHCRYCRRAHGAAFVTVSWIPRAAFHITSGADAIRDHGSDDSRRSFCGRCGTRLFSALTAVPEFVSLVIASLDEEPEHGPVVHVNVESKSGWYDILDGLPQHAALPPEARRAIDAADR